MPVRANTLWTTQERALLRARFWQGMDPKELAEAHQRTLGGVMSALVKMNLVHYIDGVYYKLEPWVTTQDLRN